MSTHYVPGGGLAVVVDGTVALLPDGAGAEMVHELWTSLLSGGSITDHLQVLLAPGLAAAPSFALVRVVEGGAHVVVRGSATVVGSGPDGERTVGAAHVATWTEATLDDLSSVRLIARSAVGGTSLPVAAAVVPAAEVVVTVGAARARVVVEPEPVAPEASAEPVEPEAPAEPEASAEPVAPEAFAEPAAPEAFDEPGEPEASDEPGEPEASDEPDPFDDPFDEPYGEPFVAPITAPAGVAVVVPAAPRDRLPDLAPDDDPEDDLDDDPLIGGVPAWSPVRSSTAPGPVPPLPVAAAPVPSAAAPVTGPAAPDLGAPTLVPAAVAPGRSGAPEDHDGLTVLSSDVVALRRQLPEWAGDAVPQLAVPTPRTPAPAKLLMSTGLVVSLNRPVLLGRAPQVTRVTNNEIPRLITVASPNQDISRTHAEVRMDGEDVVVTDLRSTNGILLLRQGQGAQRLHPGEPTVVEPGVVVDLGEGVTFLVEAGG